MSGEERARWICELLRRAAVRAPRFVKESLAKAKEREEGHARAQIESILENLEMAEAEGVPLCQDTGLPFFFVQFGTDVSSEELGAWLSALEGGVKLATESVPLRPNAVDPLSKANSGDNLGRGMPMVDLELSPAMRGMRIQVTIKGAGSENMTALKLFSPGANWREIEFWVLERVLEAGGKPCPPTFLGLGVGGTAALSLKLAERALLRAPSRNEDASIALLEEELFELVNELGVGPMGLGGNTTVLGTFVEVANTHTATLPVALKFCCWAYRRASLRVSGEEAWLEDM